MVIGNDVKYVNNKFIGTFSASIMNQDLEKWDINSYYNEIYIKIKIFISDVSHCLGYLDFYKKFNY